MICRLFRRGPTPPQPYKVKLYTDGHKDWHVKVTQGRRRIGHRDTVTKGRSGYEKAKLTADYIIERHKRQTIEQAEISGMPTEWTVPAPPTRAELTERIARLEAELEIA